MVAIKNEKVEQVIKEMVKEASDVLGIKVNVNKDVCPGSIGGMTSQILITLIGRIANKLNISIPHNCYIFHDKKTHRQLSIAEAAEKVIKMGEDGK